MINLMNWLRGPQLEQAKLDIYFLRGQLKGLDRNHDALLAKYEEQAKELKDIKRSLQGLRVDICKYKYGQLAWNKFKKGLYKSGPELN